MSVPPGDDRSAGAATRDPPPALPPRKGHWRKRVLVCGGCYFDNMLAVRVVLGSLDGEQSISTIINGGASGADRLAHAWATENNVSAETYPASWMVDGRAAGPKRNQRMIDIGKPDAVVAFPGGAGTADMVRRAKRAGIPVYQPLADGASTRQDEPPAKPSGMPK